METCTKEVKNIGCRINKLTYVFPCNMASTDDPEGVKLFGTGGNILTVPTKYTNHFKNMMSSAPLIISYLE